MPPEYIVYGSGDHTTALLRDHFFAKKIPIEFMDIRFNDVEGKPTNLRYLISRGLVTVPQVFRPDGTYVGEYEAAKMIIDKAPTPDTSNIRAA